jgi:glycosyltransferase involved in cell wall biosynthesis
MNKSFNSIFSIIIPMHNRQHCIMNAVDSVLNQSFTDFELIIVDDHSTDNSVELIKQLNDPRINLIELPVNKGAAHARNTGIRLSKGRFITFLDSDDSFEPDYLKEAYNKMISLADDQGFAWCGTRMHTLNHKNNVVTMESVWKPSVKNSAYETFLNDLHIGIGCGVTFKREVFEKAGFFNEQLPSAEDTEFFLRVSQHYKFSVIEKPLINIYKNGSDRMSVRFGNLSKAYEMFIPDHLPAINASKKLRLKYNYKLCWLSYYDNKKPRARKYFRQIIKDDLFNKKAWMVMFLFELLGLQNGAKIHQQLSKYKNVHA